MFMMRREDKVKTVESLKSLIASYKTIGLLDMAKTPARQFLRIKNNITKDGSIRMKMTRKGLIARALTEAGKPGLDELISRVGNSPALIFSQYDAFKLFAVLKKNRAMSAAKAGAVVTKDVIIPKGPTQIPPGPAIGTLGKIGLKNRVEGGKIAIIEDKTVLRAGQPVTDDLAAVFSLLKIEPIEIGIGLAAAWEDGMIYGRDVLDVDVEQYMRDIENAVQGAINLSLNTGVITQLTAPMAIQLAFLRAKSLCVAGNISDKEIVGEEIAKALGEPKAEQQAQSQQSESQEVQT